MLKMLTKTMIKITNIVLITLLDCTHPTTTMTTRTCPDDWNLLNDTSGGTCWRRPHEFDDRAYKSNTRMEREKKCEELDGEAKELCFYDKERVPRGVAPCTPGGNVARKIGCVRPVGLPHGESCSVGDDQCHSGLECGQTSQKCQCPKGSGEEPFYNQYFHVCEKSHRCGDRAEQPTRKRRKRQTNVKGQAVTGIHHGLQTGKRQQRRFVDRTTFDVRKESRRRRHQHQRYISSSFHNRARRRSLYFRVNYTARRRNARDKTSRDDEFRAGRLNQGTKSIRVVDPWFAEVRNYRRAHCGGSILSEVFILTAAHCTVNVTHRAFLTVEIDGVVRYVKKVFQHPNYYTRPTGDQHSDRYFDIAILELYSFNAINTNADTTRKVCIPGPGEIFAGQDCVVIGIGKGSNFEVKRATRRIKSDEDCHDHQQYRINPCI